MLKLNFVEGWDPAQKQLIEGAAKKVVSQLPPQHAGIINMKLVDDAEIKALNTVYSGNAYATDVLTFKYPNGLGGALADVVISRETASRQAAEFGIEVKEEVALLAIHALIHVLGKDHPDKEGREFFDRLQQEALSAVGLKSRRFEWED
jgi:probable rRNA maturation factor